MRYQLAQFDIQDCDILFLTSMLQNFAVDIVPIGHFRRLVVNGPRAIVIAEDLEKRSEEHTSELQSLMRISYAVFCLKKKKIHQKKQTQYHHSRYTNYTHNQTYQTVSTNNTDKNILKIQQ